jgi:hypothetical protein
VIAGHDIILPKTGVDRIIRLIEYNWPGLVVDHDTGAPNEAFIYKDADAKKSWDQAGGRTDSNRDTMIHVVHDETSTTLVVDEDWASETYKLGDRIKKLSLTITKSMPWEFLTADLYGSADDERLDYDNPEEWVERAVDGWMPLNATKKQVDEVLDGMTLECAAYVREQVTHSWYKRVASHLAESARESFGEDFGDPEDWGSDFTEEGRRALVDGIEGVLRETIPKHAHVWRCKQVATYVFEEEEIRRILGPEYLKDDEPSAMTS